MEAEADVADNNVIVNTTDRKVPLVCFCLRQIFGLVPNFTTIGESDILLKMEHKELLKAVYHWTYDPDTFVIKGKDQTNIHSLLKITEISKN